MVLDKSIKMSYCMTQGSEVKMKSLKEVLLENTNKNDFIKLSLNQNIKNQIEQEIKFLDHYYNKIPLRTRAYVIIHDIKEETIPLCQCGEKRAIDLTYTENGFREYCGVKCSRLANKISNEALIKLKDANWLYEQRLIKKYSILQIANLINVSETTVNKWLKHHKIDKLIDGRSRNNLATTLLQDKDKLEEIYDSGMTCEEIAKTINSSKSNVSKWLNFHKIKIKNFNSYPRKIVKTSKAESEIYEFIKTFYHNDIDCSNRSILNGRELDIYIPDKNLAIEYNGLYSHCYKPWESTYALIKDSDYHLSKTIECENKNIQLLHIYSDEWLNKKQIIQSIIKSKLQLNDKLYARKCTIVNVETSLKNVFLNENHIQGEDKSKIKIGLEYNNELLCVMTFCKSRFNKNYTWELSRFCTKINYNVIGGFSKLLNYFRQTYSGSIISYADRRYSNGSVYLKNGFKLIHVNKPSYYYVDKNYMKRYNRMSFQKKFLKDLDGTEYERARKLGFNKIYDCGTLAYVLT
jgi:transposase